MQASQLAELEVLYKEEQVLRKRYFNTIEGWIASNILYQCLHKIHTTSMLNNELEHHSPTCNALHDAVL